LQRHTAMPINYNKWDHIELSDDEDNFHPNIDNNLMIRLQREKREQREAEEAAKKKKLEDEGTTEAKAELDKMEKTKKLHVGNISQDKYNSKHTKSSSSQSANPTKAADAKVKVAALKEGEFADGYEEFVRVNKDMMLTYASIDEEDEKSEQFILDHTQLLSEHATGWYLLQCINLQAEGKTREMRKMSRQYLLLTYVCDLAKTMPGRDARDAIKPLFKKLELNQEVAEGFKDHLEKYISHVKTRAEVKKKEMAEVEEDSEYVTLQKGEQVGPGGLDPAEVFETLPEVMQTAFGERDVDSLKNALRSMSTADAEYHMKRCVDSGLWDPSGAGGGGDDDEGGADDTVSAEVDD